MHNSPSEGYRVGNLDEVDSIFICCKCQLVLRDAMMSDCGHRYCRCCLNTLRGHECLACKKEGDHAILKAESCKQDRAINNELNKKVKFCCPNPQCTFRDLLRELEKHEQNCEYQLIKCQECDHDIPQNQMKNHRENTCAGRQQRCDVCRKLVKEDEMQMHQKESCLWSRNCPFCGKKFENLQQHRWENYLLHADLLHAAIKKLKLRSENQDQSSEQSKGVEKDLLEKMNEVEDTLRKMEVTLKTQKFGLPFCPRGQDNDERRAFFSEIENIKSYVNEAFAINHEMERKIKNVDEDLQPKVSQLNEQTEKNARAAEQISILLNSMGMKGSRITALDRRVQSLEQGSSNGTLVWKLEKFKPLLKSNMSFKLLSPILKNCNFGYEFVLELRYRSEADQIGLFIRSVRGAYDAILKWPCRFEAVLSILNQTTSSHRVKRLPLNFPRPQESLGEAVGFEEFISVDELNMCGYLKDEQLFAKLKVPRQ